MENKKRIIKDKMKEELQMRRVTKKWKTMLTGIAIGVMALSLNKTFPVCRTIEVRQTD